MSAYERAEAIAAYYKAAMAEAAAVIAGDLPPDQHDALLAARGRAGNRLYNAVGRIRWEEITDELMAETEPDVEAALRRQSASRRASHP